MNNITTFWVLGGQLKRLISCVVIRIYFRTINGNSVLIELIEFRKFYSGIFIAFLSKCGLCLGLLVFLWNLVFNCCKDSKRRQVFLLWMSHKSFSWFCLSLYSFRLLIAEVILRLCRVPKVKYRWTYSGFL